MDVRTPLLPGPLCALHTHAMPAARSSHRFRKQRHRFLTIRAVTELDARHIDLPHDEHPPLAPRIPVQSHLIYAAARRPRFRPGLRIIAAFIEPRPHAELSPHFVTGENGSGLSHVGLVGDLLPLLGRVVWN